MKVAIYSAGGFTREIAYLLEDAEVLIIDDDPQARLGEFEVVCDLDSIDSLASYAAVVAFGSPYLRQRKVSLLADKVDRFLTLVAPTAHIGMNVRLGEGSIVCHNATVTADATLGRHVHMNIYSYVAHDCVVGDFVTISPRVSINGRVRVGDGAYIGSDATILPGTQARPLSIGEGAVIGAGAVVTKDVAPGSTVVGSPARPLER